MKRASTTKVKVEATIERPVDRVWELWTKPEHITQWNYASEDWQCPSAENDLRTGGRFTSRIEHKDGSTGFDFSGVYDQVIYHKRIKYTLDDGRKVNIEFMDQGDRTHLAEIFEAEDTHPIDEQTQGWQAILNTFKYYAESQPV